MPVPTFIPARGRKVWPAASPSSCAGGSLRICQLGLEGWLLSQPSSPPAGSLREPVALIRCATRPRCGTPAGTTTRHRFAVPLRGRAPLHSSVARGPAGAEGGLAPPTALPLHRRVRCANCRPGSGRSPDVLGASGDRPDPDRQPAARPDGLAARSPVAFIAAGGPSCGRGLAAPSSFSFLMLRTRTSSEGLCRGLGEALSRLIVLRSTRSRSSGTSPPQPLAATSGAGGG